MREISLTQKDLEEALFKAKQNVFMRDGDVLHQTVKDGMFDLSEAILRNMILLMSPVSHSSISSKAEFERWIVNFARHLIYKVVDIEGEDGGQKNFHK